MKPLKYKVGDSVEFETMQQKNHKGVILEAGYSDWLKDNLYVIRTDFGNICNLTEKEIDYRKELEK